ncbi:AraC-like DNA-binding protein [Allocatelliglobosispora scoriae]|uniref:AraC-like DNA-binding protein n=1 Tax=Allocatelliglobosispora scoriae TaxID=643052 RepID=A0A841BMG0_9ACTN|nr:helix-turn-helix domain-containing protein [Allocatelliglobosispora scoriae]MBB5868010.1 AraC-like DNA-binding protein [Allocatelliglobosispora scoriae]
MPLPLHRLAVPDPQSMPFAAGTFDSIGPLSRASFPHRHTFYEIVFVTGGTGEHVVDLAAHPLRPPHLCVIVPGQVHYWHEVSDLDGAVVLLTDEFLAERPRDRELLHALGEQPWRTLAPGDAGDIAAVVGHLRREYAALAPGSLGVLQAYLHILLVLGWRLGDAAAPVAGTGRAAAVTAQFTRLLNQPGGARRSVRECAARLGISMGYLGEAVREVAGHTPGQLIRRAQILEAKRLLANSPLTVAQVGRELGFDDPAYFSRFFRRETGTTPGDFRRGGRESTTITGFSPSIDPDEIRSVASTSSLT